MRQNGCRLQLLRGDDIVKTEDAKFVAWYPVSSFYIRTLLMLQERLFNKLSFRV